MNELTTIIDFTGVHNQFMATSVVMKAVRAGYVTLAEGWAQWATVEMARRDEARTPNARALVSRNRAIDAHNRRARAAATEAAQIRSEASQIAIEAAERGAMALQTALEEATDRRERAVIAAANGVRWAAERAEREEAAMSAEDRRAQRLARDQDTSDEVGRIVQGGFDLGVYGGAK